MPKYDLIDYYLSEKQQYDTLINKIGRSSSGNLSFTSTTSGITYNSSTGEQGILVAIQNALKDYLINANDWNTQILNAGYFATDTGTANTYVVTLSPVPSAYQVGMMVKFKVTNANTGTSTLNVNGLGAKTIKKSVITDLVSGDILAGQIITCIYDGTNFQIINPDLTALLSETGKVTYFARSTAPYGWLKANGSAISRTVYANLFSAIGTTFGAGDGSTTFNLPDLRGEFIRGWDDSRGVDSGRTFGSAQADDFKSHTHTQNLGGTLTTVTPNAGLGVIGQSNTSSVLATGGSETRPRNIALLACIKY